MKTEDKKPEELEWSNQPLPNIYLKLEGILYQASWIIEQEILRQKDKAEAIKNNFSAGLSGK